MHEVSPLPELASFIISGMHKVSPLPEIASFIISGMHKVSPSPELASFIISVCIRFHPCFMRFHTWRAPLRSGISASHWTSTNSAEPEQTPQNAASDQVLHCLHTECTFNFLNEIVNFYPTILKWARTCDFQQCGILTSVDSEKPVLPPFKPKNSKWCWVSSLTVIGYSRD